MIYHKKKIVAIMAVFILIILVGTIFSLLFEKKTEFNQFKGKIESTESGGSNTTGSRTGINLDVTEFTINRRRNKKDNC